MNYRQPSAARSPKIAITIRQLVSCWNGLDAYPPLAIISSIWAGDLKLWIWTVAALTSCWCRECLLRKECPARASETIDLNSNLPFAPISWLMLCKDANETLRCDFVRRGSHRCLVRPSYPRWVQIPEAI